MTQDDKNVLDQIKQLSDSILSIASDSEKLEDIKQLEKNRKDLIDQFFSKPVKQEDSQQVADVIKSVITSNEKITLIFEQNKQQISKEFNQFKASKKATSAYLSNL